MGNQSGWAWWRNWLGFAIIGTLNNLAYVVVNSAAKSLADSFGKRNLFGLFVGGNVALGFVARGINTVFLEGVRYRWRVLATCVLLTVGLVGVAVSTHISFWMALACVVVLGSASSFGESVMLTYLRLFPSDLVDGWSTGTGLAGVLGSALYLGFVSLNLSNETSFLLLLPTPVLYVLVFGLVVKRLSPEELRKREHEREHEREQEGERQSQSLIDDDDDGSEEERALLAPSGAPSGGSASVGVGDGEVHRRQKGGDALGTAGRVRSSDGDGWVGSGVATTDRAGPLETQWKRYGRCTRLVLWQAFNLFAVYFFEYVASTGAAERAEKRLSDADEAKQPFEVRHSYVILSFCYQAGVLVSRSSLKFVRISRVEVLTVLQAVNFVVWLLQADVKFMNIWVQFAAMVYVGLLGGASYVNVFYNLLHDPKIPSVDRELCINIAAFAITLGIAISSAFTVLLDETWLRNS